MESIPMRETLIVELEDNGKRIDLIFTLLVPSFNRNHASSETTHFYINEQIVKKSKKVKEGDTITVEYVVVDNDQEIIPTDIPLSILYEDEEVLVINKEQGMVVHPGSGNKENTLVHSLLFHYGEQFTKEFTDEETKERPGIVHRLDKDTSGVMVIAKTYNSYTHLMNQFKQRLTTKYYIALVKGKVQLRRGSITTDIVRDEKSRQRFTVTKKPNIGKSARTDYRVLKYYEGYTLLRIEIFTGRTHQVRVHLTSINHPVIGDPVYSRDKKDSPMLLHALSLGFTHPTLEETITCVAPLPARFKEYIRLH